MYERSSIARSTVIVGICTLGALALLQVADRALLPGLSPWGVRFIPLIAAGIAAATAAYIIRTREQLRATAESFLRESEAHFRAIAEDVTDAIIAADHDQRIVFWNAPAAQMFGYAASEVLGQSIGMLVPHERRDAHLATLRRIQQGDASATTRSVQLRAVRKDGAVFVIEMSISVRTGAERIVFTAVVRDVTERMRAAQILRQHVATMRAVTEGTSDAVWAKTVDGRYHLINSAGASMFGAPAHVIIGSDDTSIFGENIASVIRARDLEAITAGTPIVSDATGRDANGIMRQYVTTRTPWRDTDGNVIGLIGVSRDVTEKVRAERALRTSEERYRQL
ncbi:MAG TPA: PAS domain S-box protein, partial [Gemmatimonadaceae bacterium]|nr:PAS domain S-box protein [Gemmatimonadaceae bacterium]